MIIKYDEQSIYIFEILQGMKKELAIGNTLIITLCANNTEKNINSNEEFDVFLKEKGLK